MGQTYYNQITGSRIANAAREDQSNGDDVAVTGWTIGDDFILAVHMDDNSKNTEAGTYKLQWKKGAGGSFGDLANTGEINWNGSGLTDGNACSQSGGEWICSLTGSQYPDGTERLGSNATVPFDGTDGDETEHQWALNCDGATAGVTYYFQTVDTANGDRVDAIGVTITMASAEEVLTPQDSNIGLDGTDHPSLVRIKNLNSVDAIIALDGTDHPANTFDISAIAKNVNHDLDGTDHPDITVSRGTYEWFDEDIDFISGDVIFTPHKIDLEIQNSILSQSGGHPELSTGGVEQTLTVQDSIRNLSRSSVLLNLNKQLSIKDSGHQVDGSDHSALFKNQSIDVVDSNHSIDGSDHPDYIVDRVFAEQNAQHNFSRSAISLSSNISLSVQDSNIAQSGGHPQLIPSRNLASHDSSHNLDGTDHPELTTGGEQILTVQDSAHGSTRSSIVLLKTNLISTINSSIGLKSGKPILTKTGEQLLTIQNGNHTIISDFVDIFPEAVIWKDEADGVRWIDQETDFVPQEIALEIQSANHANTRRGVETDRIYLLFGSELLAVSDPTIQKIISVKPTLTANNSLADNSNIGIQSEIPQVSFATSISVDDSSLGFSGTHPNLIKVKPLSIQSVIHSHATEDINEYIQTSLDSDNAIHDHSATHPTLSLGAEQVLEPQNADHNHFITAQNVERNRSLSIFDSQLGLTTESIQVDANRILNIQSANHSHATQRLILTSGAEQLLTPQDSALNQNTNNVSINLNAEINLRNVSHKQTTEKLFLTVGGEKALSINNVNHSTISEKETNTIHAQLFVDDSSHILKPEVLNLSPNRPISIFDSQLSQVTGANLTKIKNINIQDSNHLQQTDTISLNVANYITARNSRHILETNVAIASTAQWIIVKKPQHNIQSTAFLLSGLPYAINFIARDSPFIYVCQDSTYFYLADNEDDLYLAKKAA